MNEESTLINHNNVHLNYTHFHFKCDKNKIYTVFHAIKYKEKWNSFGALSSLDCRLPALLRLWRGRCCVCEEHVTVMRLGNTK